MVEQIGTLVKQVARPEADRDIWREVAQKAAERSSLDKQEFCTLIRGTFKVIGRKPPDAETLQVMFFALHDLAIDELTFAINRYVRERSSEWLTPQLIRELSGVQQAQDAAASDAWVSAIRAVQQFGSYRTPEFGDPYVAQVIESLGGWIEFCGMSPDELRRFVRARFVNTYKAVSNRPPVQPRLRNLIDKSNAMQGTTAIAHERQRRIEARQQQRAIEYKQQRIEVLHTEGG